MKSDLPWGPLALTLALTASSCVQKRPLPSPLPPAPPPLESQSRPAEAAPAPAQRLEQPPTPARKPSFSVTMMEKSGAEPRKLAAEQSVKVVNLLIANGYDARVARETEALPASRTEAALKAAQGAQPGDLFLFGEITRGPTTEVRVTAVDPRAGKIIEDKGFRSPTAPVEEITQKVIESLLPTIETYWKIRSP